MNDCRDLLKKYNLIPKSFYKKDKVRIIESKDKKYVLKEKKRDKKDLFEYLTSRNFSFFPRIYNDDQNDSFEIYDYIEEINMPKEQKAEDIVNLMTLLHNKTTHYKTIDIEDYKIIYEELKEKIINLTDYYEELNNLLDEEMYMSPSNYLLARNISKIYSALNYCSNELDNWYQKIKNKTKERVVTVHNNLKLEHLIRNDDNYLISWDNYKIDNPIYDLYSFYKNNYDQIEFYELLKLYEAKYPLMDEERKLLFVMLSLPDKFIKQDSEYDNVKLTNSIINYLYQTDQLLSPYYSKQQNEEE